MVPSASLGPQSIPLDVATILSLAWVVSEAWARFRARGGPRLPPQRTGADRGSFLLILVSLWVTLGLSFQLYLFGVGYFLPAWTVALGAAVGFSGIGLRSWAIVVLGRFFSPIIRIESGHRLVRNGPYRWLRHPSYTGALLTLVGVAIALGSVIGILVTAFLCSLAFGYRIVVEERMLIERFGEEYREYAQGTWRLVPGLY